MFWNIFQTTYDKIEKLDFSPEIKAKLKALSDAMPADISKQLTDKVLWICTNLMKKYGKDFVAQVLNRITEYIKTTLEGLKKD